jgi:hypothetical protein
LAGFSEFLTAGGAWANDPNPWDALAEARRLISEEIRKVSLRNDGDGHEATEFYRENREAMDLGANVAWPERYNEDEISAVQHATNLKLLRRK